MREIETAETELGAGLAAPAPEPQPEGGLKIGDAVGVYVIEGYCGSGGMGVVYRARDRSLGRSAAIKLVKTARAGSSRCGVLCSLLVREAQTMAKLSHPSLLSVYAVGDFRECVYVAMEFVDGTSLGVWASGRPWRERLSALLAAGQGLAAAHRAGVFHRDFKPDNVMVSRSGQVKVMDFGLARGAADLEDVPGVGACASCASPDQLAGVLDPTAVVGTPGYMAPEQFERTGADMRSDQYAFAVSCWEILYGVWPHTGQTAAELYMAKAQGAPPPPPPSSEVPSEVETVLRRALQVSPSRRYPSLDDLVERLERAATG